MVSAPDVLPVGSQQPRLCSQGMLTMNAHACRCQIMAQAQACDLAILPALDNILESAQAEIQLLSPGASLACQTCCSTASKANSCNSEAGRDSVRRLPKNSHTESAYVGSTSLNCIRVAYA